MSLEDVVPQFDWSWHKARQAKWDARYIELARHVAQWSKDPSTKAGR